MPRQPSLPNRSKQSRGERSLSEQRDATIRQAISRQDVLDPGFGACATIATVNSTDVFPPEEAIPAAKFAIAMFTRGGEPV
jgi:hypothetical protein